MANGQAIYSSFPFDPGLAGSNWAQWKFVNALALDPLAVGAVFSVPEIMAFYPAANALPDRAAMNIRFVDANGNPGNVITLASNLAGTSTTSSSRCEMRQSVASRSLIKSWCGEKAS